MAAASPNKISSLKRLLAERFGQTDLPAAEVFKTGLPALDEIGIPRAALTECISSSAGGPGGSLLFYGLLHSVLQKRERIILIDGRDSFAPKGLPQADLNRLLWTRCRDAREAIKSADLAVRDGNVPLVLILLTLNPSAELRRIPATAWHRLQMLAEQSSVTVLIFSPQAQVGCARLRLVIGGSFPLERLHRRRGELYPALQLQVERCRIAPGRRDDEALCRSVCA